MAHKAYGPNGPYSAFAPDRTIYTARFSGYRMHAFGKDQILDYTADIEVYKAQLNPPLWVARERRGHLDPAFQSFTAEDTMRLVTEGFVTQLEPWQTFTQETFGRISKLGPKLMEPAKKKTA
jgi:hypothetical protein